MRIEKVKNLKNVTLEMIEKVFFMAMNRGWANGKILTKKAPLLPGYKCIPFITECKQFEVLDAFTKVHTNGISFGFTTIWFATAFKKIPVWTMSYGGQYPKKVIPFLKLALMENYSKQIFNGGRGPDMFGHYDFPELSYLISVRKEDSFLKPNLSQFSGEEFVLSVEKPAEVLGFHKFQGMSLI